MIDSGCFRGTAFVNFLLSQTTPSSGTPKEMKALKAAAESVDFGPDLYDAMKAKNNRWGYRAGRADINQIESWMRQWDRHKGISDN